MAGKKVAVYLVTITLRQREPLSDEDEVPQQEGPSLDILEAAIAGKLEELYGGNLTAKVEAQRTDK